MSRMMNAAGGGDRPPDKPVKKAEPKGEPAKTKKKKKVGMDVVPDDKKPTGKRKASMDSDGGSVDKKQKTSMDDDDDSGKDPKQAVRNATLKEARNPKFNKEPAKLANPYAQKDQRLVVMAHWLLYRMLTSNKDSEMPTDLNAFFTAVVNFLGYRRGANLFNLCSLPSSVTDHEGFDVPIQAILGVLSDLDGHTNFLDDLWQRITRHLRGQKNSDPSALFTASASDLLYWRANKMSIDKMPPFHPDIERFCTSVTQTLWAAACDKPRLPLIWCWCIAGQHPELSAVSTILDALDVNRGYPDPDDSDMWRSSTVGKARTLQLALEIIGWDFSQGAPKQQRQIQPELRLPTIEAKFSVPVVYVWAAKNEAMQLAKEQLAIADGNDVPKRLRHLELLQSILDTILRGCLVWFEKTWAAVKDSANFSAPPKALLLLMAPVIRMATTATSIDRITETLSLFYMGVRQLSTADLNEEERLKKKDPERPPHPLLRFVAAEKRLRAYRAKLKKSNSSLITADQKLEKPPPPSVSGKKLDKSTIEVGWSDNYTSRGGGLRFAKEWQLWCMPVDLATYRHGYIFQRRVFACDRTEVVKIHKHLLQGNLERLKNKAEKELTLLVNPEDIFQVNAGGVAIIWSHSQDTPGVIGPTDLHMMTFYLPPVVAGGVGVHLTPTRLETLLILQYMSFGAQGGFAHTVATYRKNPPLAQLEMFDALERKQNRFDFRVADFLRNQSSVLEMARARPRLVLRPAKFMEEWAVLVLAQPPQAKQTRLQPTNDTVLNEAIRVARSLMDGRAPDLSANPALNAMFQGMAAVIKALATSDELKKHERNQMDRQMQAAWAKERKEQSAMEVNDYYQSLSLQEAKEEAAKLVAMEEEIKEDLVVESPLLELQRALVEIEKQRRGTEKDLMNKKEEISAHDKFYDALKARHAASKGGLDMQMGAEQQAAIEKGKGLAQEVRSLEAEVARLLRKESAKRNEIKYQKYLDANEEDPAKQEWLAYLDFMANAVGDQTGDEYESKKMAASYHTARYTWLNADSENRNPKRYLTYSSSVQDDAQGQERKKPEVKSKAVFADAINRLAEFFGESQNVAWKEHKAAAYAPYLEAMTDEDMGKGTLLEFELLITRLLDLRNLCEFNFAAESNGTITAFEAHLGTEDTAQRVLSKLPQLDEREFQRLALSNAPKPKGDAKMGDGEEVEPTSWKALESNIGEQRTARREALHGSLPPATRGAFKDTAVEVWGPRALAWVVGVCRPPESRAGDGKEAKSATSLLTDALTGFVMKEKEMQNMKVTLCWMYALHVAAAIRASNVVLPSPAHRYTKAAEDVRRIILNNIALADRTLCLANKFLLRGAQQNSQLRQLFSAHVRLLFTLSNEICPLPTVWDFKTASEDKEEALQRNEFEQFVYYNRVPASEQANFVVLVLTHDVRLSQWDGETLQRRIDAQEIANDTARDEYELNDARESRMIVDDATAVGAKERQADALEQLRRTRADAKSSSSSSNGPPADVHLVALYGSYAQLDGLDKPTFVSAMCDAALLSNLAGREIIRSQLVPDWSVNDLHFLEVEPEASLFWLPPLVTLRDLDDVIWRQMNLYTAGCYSKDAQFRQLYTEELKVQGNVDPEVVIRGIDNNEPLVDFIAHLLTARTAMRKRLHKRAKDAPSLDLLLPEVADLDLAIRTTVMEEIRAIAAFPQPVFKRDSARSRKFRERGNNVEELSRQLFETTVRMVRTFEEQYDDSTPRRIALALPAELAPTYSPEAPGYIVLHWPDEFLVNVRMYLLGEAPDAVTRNLEKHYLFNDLDKFVTKFSFLKDVAQLPLEIIRDHVLLVYRKRAEKMRRAYKRLSDRTVERVEIVDQKTGKPTGAYEWRTRYFSFVVASRAVHERIALRPVAVVQRPEVRELTNDLTFLLNSFRDDDNEALLEDEYVTESKIDKMSATGVIDTRTGKKLQTKSLVPEEDFDADEAAEIMRKALPPLLMSESSDMDTTRDSKRSTAQKSSSSSSDAKDSTGSKQGPPPPPPSAGGSGMDTTAGQYDAGDDLSKEMLRKLIFREADE